MISAQTAKCSPEEQELLWRRAEEAMGVGDRYPGCFPVGNVMACMRLAMTPTTWMTDLPDPDYQGRHEDEYKERQKGTLLGFALSQGLYKLQRSDGERHLCALYMQKARYFLASLLRSRGEVRGTGEPELHALAKFCANAGAGTHGLESSLADEVSAAGTALLKCTATAAPSGVLLAARTRVTQAQQDLKNYGEITQIRKELPVWLCETSESKT